ncbi:MAG: hypothetical protein ACR2NZ_18390, partial [Rubripirellula sp.]
NSDDVGEANVPATVTILDGQASVSFAIIGVDDNTLDGDQVVTISAIADDFDAESSRLYVQDNEQAPFAPLEFDFGTGSSPLETGHTRVTGATTYNSDRGHGWVGGKVKALSRNAGSNLSRDLNFKNVATFAVDVPNGTYEVMLTVGDEGAYQHDQQIFLEGELKETVVTGKHEIVTRSYIVTVNDGQLTILLDGRGGADPNMVISGLRVSRSAV